MSEEKETTGGVLVIPDDKMHPASFSWVSPRERRIIRDGRGHENHQPVVYTFLRGRPARVDNAGDYQDLLEEKVYLPDRRGFAPMFKKVVASQGPGKTAAEQKITALFQQFLDQRNIDLEKLVASASGEESSPPPSPKEVDTDDNQSV